jgi:methyltransferase-like protein/SAM-dependent methyltransferase
VTTPTNYDVVAYPGYTHAQTHPNRLAVTGTLFGLEPAPVTRCRVLELGCGNGSNLVPMAFGLPESDFLGLDLAANPIAHGQRMIEGLGLKNIQLLQGNLTEFDGRHGKFDYLIAHGLFSWVPPEVRDRLLALCRQCLAPHGIAFISYNALPGSHLRKMTREMMLFHLRDLRDPDERVRQALALAQFLADAVDTDDVYRLWMKSELETLRRHEAGHLYHDELAEVNEPFYFTQFVEQAASHGLKYLGEADYSDIFNHGFNEATKATLRQLSGNRILREQYLDFLRCRRFRQTLLCHSEAPINQEPVAEKVGRFLISTLVRRTGDVNDLSPGKIISYVTAAGAKCATDFPLGKAALEVLGQDEWRPLPFAELLAQASSRLAAANLPVGCPDPHAELCAFLLQLHAAGAIGFRTWLPPAARTVSERPVVSALARWQIQQHNCVTSQFHLSIEIQDEIGRLLLASLDGTRDHATLAEKMLDLLNAQNALATTDGDAAATRRKVELDLQNNLEKLGRLGLLVA